MGASAVIELFNNNSNLITIILAISAIIISIIAIYKASKDIRKQILVGKFEEIYELISSTLVEYDLLYNLYSTLQKYHNDESDISSLHNDYFAQFSLEVERIKSTINTDELFNKILRLNVLSNTYLDKSLIFEVNAYCKLFEDLIITTIQRQLISEETEFKEGFPTNENLYKFAQPIVHKIIKKINLGAEIVDTDKFNNYIENDFKKLLGLK